MWNEVGKVEITLTQRWVGLLLIEAIGLEIGWRHWFEGRLAFFTLGSGQILPAIWILFGPLLILPAVLLGLLSRLVGGVLLIVGAIVSTLSLIVLEWGQPYLVRLALGLVWNTTGKMLWLGVSLIWLASLGPLVPTRGPTK